MIDRLDRCIEEARASGPDFSFPAGGAAHEHFRRVAAAARRLTIRELRWDLEELGSEQFLRLFAPGQKYGGAIGRPRPIEELRREGFPYPSEPAL